MVKRAPARRRPRKAKPGTKGLGPVECRLQEPTGAAAEAAELVEKSGGCVVGSYKEPLGGHPILLAILPIDAVEPTPFQRCVSSKTRAPSSPSSGHRECDRRGNKRGNLESAAADG